LQARLGAWFLPHGGAGAISYGDALAAAHDEGNGTEVWRAGALHRVKKTGRISAKTGGIGPVRITKPAGGTVHCFKISEKDKSQQKICKKTRSNFKVTSEEIFVKPSHLNW
jgi:hypothetical protein